MSGLLDRATVHRAWQEIRRGVRRALGLTTVKHATPRMFPGAVRLGQEEEEAAVTAVREVMRSKRLFRFFGVARNPWQASRVRRLERDFAGRMGVEHALAVNSGTSALVCALVGLGVGPEDEVIIPAYTWVSSASAVLAVGAVPIIAEVDDSLTLDPADVARRITPQTRVIVPVHMRGAPADMAAVRSLADAHGLVVLEDAAQATGAQFRGSPVGSLGDAGAFSFHLTKIMTAGEGGMVTTNDPEVYRRAAMYHDSAACPHLGVAMADWIAGLNLRMSEIHAAIAQVQLGRLTGLLADMRTRKARLEELVADDLVRAGATLRRIHDPKGDACTCFVFFLPEKAAARRVVSALVDEDVPASRLYQDGQSLPRDHVDLHAVAAWAPILEKRTWTPRGGPWRGHPREIDYRTSEYPVTMDLLARAVHIDISPELTPAQVEQMSAAIRTVVATRV